ncbi:MAG: hypothetical protein U0X71_02260 [Sphingobacteriaceae bacterium]
MKVTTRNWYYPLFITGALLMMTSSCKKNNLKLATVTTSLNSVPTGLAVDPNVVVVVTGNVIDNGGAAIVERGVVYNIVSLDPSSKSSPNAAVSTELPTLGNCTRKSVSSDFTGQRFSVNISAVTSGYYIVRAYVTTRNGVAYGNVENFSVQGTGGVTQDIKDQAAALKSMRDDVAALKQKVSDLGNDLVKKVNAIDVQALSNTLAGLVKSNDDKLNSAKVSLEQLIAQKFGSVDLSDANSALSKLLASKLNSSDFVDAKNQLQSLIDLKASTQDLTNAKVALQSLIDLKASTQDLTDARTALQLLIDAKASTKDLTDTKAALQSLIDLKASTQDLTNAKVALQSLIDLKASTQDLTDARTALQLLIDTKANSADLEAARDKLSRLEQIILNINPISSIGVTELGIEGNKSNATVAIILDHISIDPNKKKPLSEIKKLEYVCFEANQSMPDSRTPIAFDFNSVADGSTSTSIPLKISELSSGRTYKFIVYATMVGTNKVHDERTFFVTR